MSYWQKYAALAKKVRQDHAEKNSFGHGHDFWHAAMVAEYGARIAEDERSGELTWLAGLIHNTDRMFPMAELEPKLVEYLSAAAGLTVAEINSIVMAVLTHDQANNPEDNPVTVGLKDADRLGNLGPAGFIRAGQYHAELAPFDPRFITSGDPTATFPYPKTVLENIRHRLEWESLPKVKLRLPKAQVLGAPLFDQIRRHLAEIEIQLKDLGLSPPPPLD